MTRVMAAAAAAAAAMDPAALHTMPPHRTGTGREGRLSVSMRRDESDGRTVLTRCRSEPPLSVQRTLYCEQDMPEMAYVYVSSTSGGMLQGDRHMMAFDAGPRTAAHVTTQGATRIHGNPRTPHEGVWQYMHMTLDEGAYLEYMPDQVIPYAHSAFSQDARIAVHKTATLVYSEIISQGRAGMGESFEYRSLDSRMRITGFDGALRFADASKIAPHGMPGNSGGAPGARDVKSFAIMSGYDVVASLYIITEEKFVPELQDKIDRMITRQDQNIAGGAAAMRNNTGVLARLLGPDTESLKRVINMAAALARQAVLDAPFTEVRKS